MSDKSSVYTVVSGDNLTLIARRFGFRNYQTIYDHELNSEFKKSRPNPNIIHPGDEIIIPNKVMKTVPAAEGKVQVYRLVKEKQIPSSGGQQIGILPVRYAFSDKMAESLDEEREQLDSTGTNLESGLMSSGMRDYTLRQLRDGWLYVYNDTKSELDEYQITGSTYTKYEWDTIDQHATSQAGDAKSILLYNTSDKLTIAFAPLRWTDRVCEHMSNDAGSRDAWMRQLNVSDYKVAPHTANITKLSELVADVDIEGEETFNNTCTPLSYPELEGNNDGLVSHKAASTEVDHTVDLPENTAAIIVALDDSLADVKDLYIALAQPYARHSLVMGSTEEEVAENTRKWEMAQFTKSLARVQLSGDELPSKIKDNPKLKSKFNIDFNEYLNRVEAKNAYSQTYAATQDMLGTVGQKYDDKIVESKNKLLAKYNFESTGKQDLDFIAQQKNKYQDEVRWDELDAFCDDIEPKLKVNLPLIKQAHQDLLVSLQVIGIDAMKLGFDVENTESMIYLLNLSNALTSMLMLTTLDEDGGACLKSFLTQQSPDNLLSLTTFCFSTEYKKEFEERMSLFRELKTETDSGNYSFARSAANGSLWVGRFSEIDTLMGFNVAGAQGSTWYPLVQSAIQRTFSAFKEAAKGAASSAWGSLQTSLFTNALPSIVSKNVNDSIIHHLRLGLLSNAIEENSIILNEQFDIKMKQFNADLDAIDNRLKPLLRSKANLNSNKNTSGKGNSFYAKKFKKEAIDIEIEKLVNQKHIHIENKPDLLVFENEKMKQIDVISSQSTAELAGTEVAKRTQKAQVIYEKYGATSPGLAMLNFVNLLYKAEDYANSYDYLDDKQKSRINKDLASTFFWTASSISDVFRGVHWAQVQNQGETLLALSLREAVSHDTYGALVKRFSISMGTMAGFGLVAAGVEAWMTWDDIDDAGSELEDSLLWGKLGALAVQGGVFSVQSVRWLLSQFGSRALGTIFLPWMTAVLAVSGIVYLIVSVVLGIIQKTPLEIWVNKSTWGKRQNIEWTAEQELLEYDKIVRKPVVEITMLVEKETAAQKMGYGREPNKKRLVIFVPGVKPNDEVDVGIIKHSYVSTSTRIRDISDIPAVASLTLDDLNQGTWTEQDGLWQYSVDVVVEAERDSFNVDIVVPAGDSEIEYKATGSEGSLTVHVQDQVTIESSSNLFTSRVGHHE
ncbi:putative membrane protein [Moritella sp. JT01]|uniref:toxin VasX n=1 Tax=Moritella sp. JT01 TaxID=756698 RepID=UPI00079597D9|nr:toxin VasX [Moritella sp. JT01]KXO08361.1 putative membrane protein [Moritella sp. JT01]